MSNKAWRLLLQEAVQIGTVPDISAGCVLNGKIEFASYGSPDPGQALEAAPGPSRFLRFDCASLTKVVVTLPLILLLADRGKLSLDDPISRYISGFERSDKSRITIRHLLTHSSGLAAEADFYTERFSLPDAVARISEMPLAAGVGERIIYSDLGYLLLGELAAGLWEMELDTAARLQLFDPLEMADSGYVPASALRETIAPTEQHAPGQYWQGIVHDENARGLGGICGHAGLFSTAADLLKMAGMWLSALTSEGSSRQRPLLSAAIAREAVSLQSPVTDRDRRGLGWVLRGDWRDVSGPNMSEQAFGHTGFTGTSLYVDPDLQLGAVLLTNRVRLGRQTDITGLRRSFHAAAATIACGKS